MNHHGSHWCWHNPLDGFDAPHCRMSRLTLLSLMPVEEIARLAGHASSRTTEVIYRRELRPVITTGAEVMDQIFQAKQGHKTAADLAG